MKRLLIKPITFLLAISLLLGGPIAGNAVAQNVEQESNQTTVHETIFMHTGSPLILSNDKIMAMDPYNLDVAAIVLNARTLVPLRAISEYFGADVSYNEKHKQAIIDYAGMRYIFPINETKYIASDTHGEKVIEMDTSSQIINDRVMVPVRVISERILDKKVAYYDHVICISNQKTDLEKDANLVQKVKDRIGSAVKVQSVAELEQFFDEYSNEYHYVAEYGANIEITRDTMMEEKSTSNEMASDANYSETNVQVEGIDEADIVKTDGKYIYLGGNNVVRIVGADKGEMKETSAIRLPLDKSVSEFYLDNDRLVIMGNKYQEDEIMPLRKSSYIGPIHHNKSFSFIDVYDISNPQKPILIKGHEMEGNYQSSRKNNDVVYMITSTYFYENDTLPVMKDSVMGQEISKVPLDDIMIMPEYPAHGYLVISALNINNEDTTEVEAIAASGYTFYMNDAALYITGDDYSGNTSILKFELNGTKVGYAGSTKVKGSVLNQFSIDESQGYLRIATTMRESENNALYVLDDSLNICGSVPKFATGEQIYSVRFFGDKAYIVTFRTIDPLFIFDLSNPKDPKITGELKVPGFSNYLHPVGEDQILGIGRETVELLTRDADGNETVVGVRNGGLKCSLFDVSDMGQPKELDNLIIGTSGSYSEALYNHKSIMINASKTMLAFDASIVDDGTNTQSKRQAILVDYGQKNLKLYGTLDATQAEAYGSDIPYGRRVIYIGDVLFYIQDGVLVSYDYKTLNKIDTLAFQ